MSDQPSNLSPEFEAWVKRQRRNPEFSAMMDRENQRHDQFILEMLIEDCRKYLHLESA